MANRMTLEEKESIKTMIRSGMTKAQISEKTGRSDPTIQAVRNELKREEFFDDFHVGGMISKGVPCPVIDKKVEAAEKQRKESSLVLTRKVVRFSGIHTNYEYIVGSNADELIVRDEKGNEFRIEFRILEGFATELLDIISQTDEIKKLVL